MRRKADGTAFEGEFSNAVSDAYYVKRLRTANTGYAGIREPADYIVVGRQFNYVELKETAGDSFSITGMEQYDKMLEFLDISQALRTVVDVGLEYWLIVHFLKTREIKVVSGRQAEALSASRKALRIDTDTLTFKSLEELKGAHLF